jgi:hypothetical protein
MGDVPVAPQGGAPAAVPTEAPVNEHPTSAPTPIGSQAPDAPENSSSRRTPTRQEAIQRAFERASNPPPKTERRAEKPTPKPAEAKPGHNSGDEAEPEKFDLKKRPSEQKGDIRDPQPRDRGRFASREPQQAAPNVVSGGAGGDVQPPAKQLPEGAPFRDPPQRMAEHGKRDWATTPETVRGEFHRMQAEFSKHYNTVRKDLDAFKPVRQFHELALQHGTTLEKALTNYTQMEAKLRADPIAGLDLIVHNLGLKTADGQRVSLRDIAYHVLSQTPDQLRQVQMGNTQQAAAHQIGALHQQIAQLQNTVQQMHNQQQFTYTRSQVDQFADAHPRFDELGNEIEQELKLGFDLETAYRRAELLKPATHAAQTRTTTPSAQTRTPDRSISGAPDVAPSNGASRRRSEPSRSTRDAVEKAMRFASGI